MIAHIHFRIACHIQGELIHITFGDSGCLFLTTEEAQRLLVQLDEMLFLAPSGDDRHCEVADVPMTHDEVVAVREEMAAALEQGCDEEDVDWKREGL